MDATILVAGDHPLFRAAVLHVLRDALPGVRILEASSVSTLAEVLAVEPQVDLVLLDLAMPGARGLSSLVYLRGERPEVPVLVISSNDHPRTIRRVQQFGAAGFLSKSSPADAMGAAVHAILDGGEWFPPLTVERSQADAELAARLAQLTPQQFRVLLCIADGLLNKQIAHELGLAENTVKVHVTAILKKLGCHYYCRNHPKPDEPQYPLWQGLPLDSTMTRAGLRARVDDCTGIDRPPSRRTPEQAARLADILAVTGIAEKQLVAHLAWGTFHFRDLVQRHLGGRNPFDNSRTVYRGSRDDDALNGGVERFVADPAAVAALAYDADLSGLIVLPTLNLHVEHDPVVSPSALDAYRRVVEAAGRGHLLAQFRIGGDDHSRPGEAAVLAALRALEAWLDTGVKPDAAALEAACRAVASGPGDCRFVAP